MNTLRVATFNVENLFSRPKAMNFPTWKQGQPILDDFHRLDALLSQDSYSAKDKAAILALLEKYGLTSTRPQNPYLELRTIRGGLLKRSKNAPPVVIADGRGDWVGWVELKKDAIEDQAIENLATIIAEVNAHVLVLVEVEDRPTLARFHNMVLVPILKKLGYPPYDFNMVIDGNDRRGIDVGILSRKPIIRMRSHIDHKSNGKPTFSRDCPEYYIQADGTEIVILPNHFASKGSDPKGARRRVQAAAVKEIYDGLRETHEYVIVAGDFNDDPSSRALDDVLVHTNLKDAMSLPMYSGYPGTYQHANASQKLDYLLFSPALVSGVTKVDLDRRGFYAPNKWKSFDNLTPQTKDRYQASDHHCLWADITLP